MQPKPPSISKIDFPCFFCAISNGVFCKSRKFDGYGEGDGIVDDDGLPKDS